MKKEFAAWLPTIFVAAWWVYDLQFQWRAHAEYQYGWLVLFLAAFLIWDRWPTRPTKRAVGASWSIGALAGVGFLFLTVAEMYKQGIANTPASSFSLSLGCVCFIAALLLSNGGRDCWRHFRFPVLFMFAAVPLPAVFWTHVVMRLQGFVTMIDVEILNLMGIAARKHGVVIELPNVVVGVDEACSGIRSLQSSLMAGLFLGDVLFRRTAAKIFLVVAAMVAAIGGNILRSLILCLKGNLGGSEAIEAFHDAAGWGILLFTTTVIAAVAWVITRIERDVSSLKRNQITRAP